MLISLYHFPSFHTQHQTGQPFFSHFQCVCVFEFDPSPPTGSFLPLLQWRTHHPPQFSLSLFSFNGVKKTAKPFNCLCLRATTYLISLLLFFHPFLHLPQNPTHFRWDHSLSNPSHERDRSKSSCHIWYMCMMISLFFEAFFVWFGGDDMILPFSCSSSSDSSPTFATITFCLLASLPTPSITPALRL